MPDQHLSTSHQRSNLINPYSIDRYLSLLVFRNSNHCHLPSFLVFAVGYYIKLKERSSIPVTVTTIKSSYVPRYTRNAPYNTAPSAPIAILQLHSMGINLLTTPSIHPSSTPNSTHSLIARFILPIYSTLGGPSTTRFSST